MYFIDTQRYKLKSDVQVVRIWLSSERRRLLDVLRKSLQTYSKKILRMYIFLYKFASVIENNV